MSRAKRLGRVSWQAFILGPPCSGWQERFGKTGLGCPSLGALKCICAIVHRCIFAKRLPSFPPQTSPKARLALCFLCNSSMVNLMSSELSFLSRTRSSAIFSSVSSSR